MATPAPKPYRIEAVLLQGLQSDEPAAKKNIQDTGIGDIGNDLGAKYGIRPEDRDVFGFNQVVEVGKAVITIASEEGETGHASIAMGERYQCAFDFVAVREPYLVLKGILLDEEKDQTILENTLFLKDGAPTLLGLTNLRGALMLVIKLTDPVE